MLLRAREVVARGRAPSARTLIDLFYHLSVLIAGGVPILRGLQDIARQGDHPLSHELQVMALTVEAGGSLSDALALHPEQFPTLSVSIVRAGEKTGKLDEVLRDLADHLEWRDSLVRRVRGAITYPIVVCIAMGVLCGALAFYVLPQFVGLFTELGVELPAALRVLLWLKTTTGHHGLVFAALVAGGGIALLLWQKTEPGRLSRDRLLLRLPVVGSLILMIDLSRFSHNLALFFRSGLPIHESLTIVTGIVQNRVISQRIANFAEQVRGGSGLVEAISASGQMPGLLISMLQVGEATGNLDEALERVSSFYDREVPAVIDRAVTLFNGLVLISLGGIILTIALSFFVPLYETYGELSGI